MLYDFHKQHGKEGTIFVCHRETRPLWKASSSGSPWRADDLFFPVLRR
jgi:hypothetical protein